MSCDYESESDDEYTIDDVEEVLKEKGEALTQIINIDTDEDGYVTSTDEKLYNIMTNKKNLMEQFLTSIKESSIDCMIHYDSKEKCLSFPLKDVVNPRKALITKIKYTDNAYESIEKTKIKPQKEGVDNEESEEEDETEEDETEDETNDKK